MPVTLKRTREEIEAMNVAELRALARECGLDSDLARKGKKDELRGALLALLPPEEDEKPEKPGDPLADSALEELPVDGGQLLARKKSRLAVDLTDDEWRSAASRLAALEEQIGEEAEHQKQVKADLRHRMAQLDAERSTQAMAVRRKSEMRDVPVETWADFARGMAVEVRTDTGVVVHERPLTSEEKQQELFARGSNVQHVDFD